MATCWCVCVYYYNESCSFFVEHVYYSPDAERLAIHHAISENLKLLQDEYECEDKESIDILTDTSKTESERLQTYIESLDYSHGNFRYDECVFYDVSQVTFN